MNKVILTQGIQGSGKTTWAKAWVAQDPERRIRINNDDITAMISKLDIVIDNMNLSNSSLKEIMELVEDTDYVIEYKDFTKVPLEVCIARDAMRPNPIGAEIIINNYNKYIKNG